jgi:NHL repeat
MKLSPDGRVLLTLGKEGVGGSGTDTFDRPNGVAVAPNGDIFVSDGHHPNKSGNARVIACNRHDAPPGELLNANRTSNRGQAGSDLRPDEGSAASCWASRELSPYSVETRV